MRKATMGAGAYDMVHSGVAFRCIDRDPVGAPFPRRRLDPPDPHLRIVRRNMAIIFGLATILWAAIVFLVLLALF